MLLLFELTHQYPHIFPSLVMYSCCLQPWDEQYLRSLDPPIKFLSFHSHIRKLRGGVDK